MNRRERKRQATAIEWLHRVVASATRRIDLGDLDFDDVLYRGRDAATTLLEIFDPHAVEED